jgi:GMP synthase (glutamine-hydrolysing)
MILIVDMNDKRYPLAALEFVQPISRITSKMEISHIAHYTEVNLEIAVAYEKIILSGNSLKDGGFRAHVKDFQWMEKYERPILGICAGMQAMGLVFGSPLMRCEEIGMTNIRTVTRNPLFSSAFAAYELHTYAVNPSEFFEPLALSESCIQAVKYKEKDIYGVLFHPEVRNREIIENFLSI